MIINENEGIIFSLIFFFTLFVYWNFLKVLLFSPHFSALYFNLPIDCEYYNTRPCRLLLCSASSHLIIVHSF